MRTIGIDPGLSGALAVVEMINGVPMLLAAIDMPIIGTGTQRRLDAIGVAEWINKHAPSMAYIEAARSMPRQGIAGTFRYARATGAIETVLTLCRIPTIWIEPSKWKRQLRLPGKDKEAARQRALQLFPSAHSLLARKKDHGRAEAALIALHVSGGV
jgi:Holliday junction resolvasome RuvABC endonuclease subunit